MNHSFDPYNVLGIDKNASLHEIKFAYFKKVKESPPEVDPINFKRIRQAYESLKDERRRIETDVLSFRELKNPFNIECDIDFSLPDEAVYMKDILDIMDTDINKVDFFKDFQPID